METNFSFRIPEKLLKEFREKANKNAHNSSALLRKWIEEYVKGK